MRFGFALFILVLSYGCLSTFAADARTGEFEIQFDQHSPLVNSKSLNERLNLKDAGDDDDLPNAAFECYVPADAQTSATFGLIVWLNYRSVEKLPPKLLPVLDQSHTILIACKSTTQPAWARAGRAVDAAFNLQQRYPIDEHRRYCFSLLPPDDVLGQQMGVGFPDVFDGFCYVLNLRYFRQITSNGASYAASFTRPTNGQITGLSKQRTHVLVGDFRIPDSNQLVLHAYVNDGYSHTSLIETSLSTVRWPDVDADWFKQALNALDNNVSSTPTTAPTPTIHAPERPGNLFPGTTSPVPGNKFPVRSVTSAPAAPDATRMLSLAKAFQAAHDRSGARRKLEELLEQFPDDPAADEARQLLKALQEQ